ncbi:hypothetical protein JNUCC42_14710 [Brevibacterium sp. JNUCC-42]|nr:hypothetical protein JNUCC42_14710 [Brevibacterium sp. JNUCC-42]
MIEEERARNSALVAKSLPPEEVNVDKEKDKESITDMAVEDRSKLKEAEVEAEETVLRFFNAVNKRLANYEANDEGVMGAEKATSLLTTEIKPRIVRSDIREDLLQQSAERVMPRVSLTYCRQRDLKKVFIIIRKYITFKY